MKSCSAVYKLHVLDCVRDGGREGVRARTTESSLSLCAVRCEWRNDLLIQENAQNSSIDGIL